DPYLERDTRPRRGLVQHDRDAATAKHLGAAVPRGFQPRPPLDHSQKLVGLKLRARDEVAQVAHAEILGARVSDPYLEPLSRAGLPAQRPPLHAALAPAASNRARCDVR